MPVKSYSRNATVKAYFASRDHVPMETFRGRGGGGTRSMSATSATGGA
jgi:hypothetical protein